MSDVECSFQSRVREAIEFAGGPVSASEKTGLSRRVIDKYRNGESDPYRERLIALAKAGSVDVGWLATGEEKMRHEMDAPNAQLSAGNGNFVTDGKVLDHIPFTSEFFEKRLHRKPEDMIIVDARGESMEPTMRDRDLIMIDTASAKRPVTSAIYGFTYGPDVYVKRLEVMRSGILVKSDNKEYGEFIIERSEIDQFHPIGRVVWIGRTL